MSTVNETSISVPDVTANETAIVGFQNLNDIRAPYLNFPMKMSKKWAEYVGDFPELREYEPLVVTPSVFGDTVKRVATNMAFNCVYLNGYQCYTNVDIDNGQVLDAAIDPKYVSENKDRKLVEHCEAVLLVFSPDGTELYPCRGAFRKALSSVVKSMEKFINTVKQVDEPQVIKDWYAKGMEYKATAAYPLHYRAICRVEIFSVPTRENPNYKYPTGRVKFLPMMPAQLELIQACSKDESFMNDLQSSVNAYAYRNREINTARSDK